MRPRLLVPLAALAALPLGAVGCGGGDDGEKASGTKTTRTQERDTRGSRPRDPSGSGRGRLERSRVPASPADRRVIERWSTALREGHVQQAAGYWALPAIAQNGTPPLRLSTRRQVLAFNVALPCGARLVSAFRTGAYTVATFELTERTGPGSRNGCDGTGERASTAFRFRKGKIAEWLRVNDPIPEEGAAPAAGGPTI